MPNKAYERIIPDTQETIDILRRAKEKGYTFGITLSNFDYKKWTRQDYVSLALCPDTGETFNNFVWLMDKADERVGGKQTGPFTPDALDARSVLERLKPAFCKDVDAYCAMIEDVAVQTLDQRKKIKALYPEGLELCTQEDFKKRYQPLIAIWNSKPGEVFSPVIIVKEGGTISGKVAVVPREKSKAEAEADLGPYAPKVRAIKRFHEIFANEKCVSGAYNTWTSDDLRTMATNPECLAFFEALVDNMRKTDKDNNTPSKDAQQARNMLTVLAPGTMTWREYANMIEQVRKETLSKRDAMKKDPNNGEMKRVFLPGDHLTIASHDFSSDICLSEVNAQRQQELLANLDAHRRVLPAQVTLAENNPLLIDANINAALDKLKAPQPLAAEKSARRTA